MRSEMYQPITPAEQTMTMEKRLKSVAWRRVVGSLAGAGEDCKGTAGERWEAETEVSDKKLERRSLS